MRLRSGRLKSRATVPVAPEKTTVVDGQPYFVVPPEAATPRPDLLQIGAHSYTRPVVQWHAGDTACVKIGRYCSVHSTVNIFVGGEHRPDWITQYPLRERFDLPGAYVDGLPMTRGDVLIGNDVYVGFNTTILSGVRIGDGAVIGASALVTSDVPPYAVHGGVPARFIHWRFGTAERESLQRLKWWDWPDEKVIDNVSLLCSSNLSEFLTKHDPEYQPDNSDV